MHKAYTVFNKIITKKLKNEHIYKNEHKKWAHKLRRGRKKVERQDSEKYVYTASDKFILLYFYSVEYLQKIVALFHIGNDNSNN